MPRENEDFEFEFKFLTSDESKKGDNNHVWYRVSKVLNCSYSEVDKIHYQELKENNDKKIVTSNRSIIKPTLKLLHKRICGDKYVAHFDLAG